MANSLGLIYLAELEAEAGATRKCLERIPESLYTWKAHEKSLNLGYVAHIVAEIPLWIQVMCQEHEIDFATFKHAEIKTTMEMVRHFDENLAQARRALAQISGEEINLPFALKANGQLISTTPRKAIIGSSINHLVHHRGQLTVYMRLNSLPVPSVYGPSADDKSF